MKEAEGKKTKVTKSQQSSTQKLLTGNELLTGSIKKNKTTTTKNQQKQSNQKQTKQNEKQQNKKNTNKTKKQTNQSTKNPHTKKYPPPPPPFARSITQKGHKLTRGSGISPCHSTYLNCTKANWNLSRTYCL